MNPPDELTLMAYADGELEGPAHEARRLEVEAALAADPALAARVRQQQALRRRLAAALAPELDEAVPDRLLQLLQPPAAAPVHDLAAARAERQAQAAARAAAAEDAAAAGKAAAAAQAAAGRARPRSGGDWSRWGGLAASLALGLVIGSLWTGRGADAPAGLAAADRPLRATGALAQALDKQVAGSPGAVAVTLSFKDRDGRYCRAFTSAAQAGLACREDGGWTLATLVAPVHAEAPAAEGGLRQAATALPPLLLQAVDERIAGEALDAAGERAALARGWQR